MRYLYVTTTSGTINAFLVPHIKMLIKQGNLVDIACSITSPISNELIEMGCRENKINCSRNILSLGNYQAYNQLKKLIQDGKYDVVHTHTPVASAITRLVCKNIKGTKVFYTAHGFHFHKGAPLKNWLIYYPLEKWLAKYTDTLITINKEDYEIAKNKFKAKRVEHIPGVGLDINKFRNVVVDKVGKRQELGLPEDAFVILSVGELNKNKNHEVVIRAIAKLNNPNIHYVICGKGALEPYLKKLSTELGIGGKVHLLGYRQDIAEICKTSDIFTFPSLREGLPVSLMEAMACGLPVICSNVRGNRDLVQSQKNGYLLEPNDVQDFGKAIDKLISKYQLQNNFAKNNLKKIKHYSLQKILLDMDKIYKNSINS